MRVLEGTWEEVKRHEAELVGRHVRVIIDPKRSTTHKRVAAAKKSTDTIPAKQLQGRGMFAGIVSTEEYLREKREDIARSSPATTASSIR